MEKNLKKNKHLLFEKFASNKIYKPNEDSISLFMAGSPGAGKTEYSKRFIEKFNSGIVRIDADDKGYFLNKPSDAFKVMRNLGLGITNADIRKIEVVETE